MNSRIFRIGFRIVSFCLVLGAALAVALAIFQLVVIDQDERPVVSLLNRRLIQKQVPLEAIDRAKREFREYGDRITAMRGKGEIAKAAESAKDRLDRIEKLVGPEHELVAECLTDFALLHEQQSKLAGADPTSEALLQRSLKITENAFGAAHPKVAFCLMNVAASYEHQRKFAAAVSLYQRALMIREMASKAAADPYDDPYGRYASSAGGWYIVQSLSALAKAYTEQGNYAAAEPLIQRSLKIGESIEQKSAPKDVDVPDMLSNLGLFFESQGNYAAAEPLFQRALEIHDARINSKHWREMAAAGWVSGVDEAWKIALALENLGRLYSQTNNGMAEPLLKRALSISEKNFGPEHMYAARSSSVLAHHYKSQAKFADAESLFDRALRITEKLFGREHAETAISLENLAELYQSQGKHSAAEPLHQRTLKIIENSFGHDHPNTVKCLRNLALLYKSQGNYDRAKQLAMRVIDIERQQLERTAVVQSEQQQLFFAAAKLSALNSWLYVTSQDSVASVAWDRSLPWKGLTTLRQSALRKTLGRDPLFAKYRQIAEQLSTVTLSPPRPPSDPTEVTAWLKREPELLKKWEAEIKRLEGIHTDLEKQLTEKSSLLSQTQKYRRVTSDDIVAVLRQQERSNGTVNFAANWYSGQGSRDGQKKGRRTALVDLVAYEYMGQDAREGEKGESTNDRIAAFIARSDRDAQRVELGATSAILNLINVWRRTLGAGDEGREAAQQLRQLLWHPLEAKLDGIDTVLISPDGALSQFPWNALPGSKEGSFLIEERSIAMIPIPQLVPELLRPGASKGPPETLLLAGDIDYSQIASTPGDLLLAGAAVGRHERSGELRHFSALSGARPELDAIHSRFSQAARNAKYTELTKGAATEEAFRQAAERHPWLHIVTHGFFAPETIKSALQSRGNPSSSMSDDRKPSMRAPHPGTLSGLAFAGANNSPEPDKDDGILTAMEVAALDLQKVNMVVLSACETGLGEVAGGEGLLGLQRAFQLAGAKTCVASLWSVHDAGTRVLMERFYDNLWQKKLGKLEALREAQLWVLRNPKEFYAKFTEDERQADAKHRGLDIDSLSDPINSDTTPPYYWAAFVLSGDWR